MIYHLFKWMKTLVGNFFFQFDVYLSHFFLFFLHICFVSHLEIIKWVVKSLTATFVETQLKKESWKGVSQMAWICHCFGLLWLLIENLFGQSSTKHIFPVSLYSCKEATWMKIWLKICDYYQHFLFQISRKLSHQQIYSS